MQQALDALRYARKAGDMHGLELKPVDAAFDSLRAALAQQDEPVAWIWAHPTADYGSPARQVHFHHPDNGFPYWSVTPLYAAPQPAPVAQPLTDEQIDIEWFHIYDLGISGLQKSRMLARAIERAHKIGGPL